MTATLVLFHCESNPGFAASSHEHTFLEVAKSLSGDFENIHFGYRDLSAGMSEALPKDLTNVIEIDTSRSDRASIDAFAEYISKHNIVNILGFDQPVHRSMYRAMRTSGVKRFVSYWGAPMSSPNSGIKLLLKRIEVAVRGRYGPDRYIFQSEGMQNTAVNGRGIPKRKTSIVRTGIDTDKFSPSSDKSFYAHDQFNIPQNKSIVVFSGHMERRKGVHVILEAARKLVKDNSIGNLHFLILGNRPGEVDQFDSYFEDKLIKDVVTFGGYRNDIERIFPSCFAGIIASTGWDSFPMSSLEMASCELPLLVSNLPGLKEAVTEDTGLVFEAGNHEAAAEALLGLIKGNKSKELGKQGRQRVLAHFSRSNQANGILKSFKTIELK